MAHLQKNIDVDLGPIVALYESHRRVGEDGKTSYSGLLLEDLITMVETCLEVSSEIPEAEKRRMILDALRSNPDKPLAVKTIISEVSKREAAYKKIPLTDYILATSISIRQL